MTSYQWYLTDRRRTLLELVKKLPDAGGQDFSQVMEKALEEYLQKHGEGNPAFQLEKWIEEPEFRAEPTFGENPAKWLANSAPAEVQHLSMLAEGWRRALDEKLRVIPPAESPEEAQRREERRQQVEKLDAAWRKRQGKA